ncbi:MFS transporter [Streptomyces violaceorubidus]
MAFLGAGSTASALVPGLLLAGVGTGLVSPGIAGAALAAVPAERSGMAGGAVNTSRQLGYALGIAVFGTVLTSRMQDTLPHDAAHGLAGGAAGALRGVFGEHALRAAFASGLNAAAVTAGAVAAVAGVLVLVLVRASTGAAGSAGVGTDPAPPALEEEKAASR